MHTVCNVLRFIRLAKRSKKPAVKMERKKHDRGTIGKNQEMASDKDQSQDPTPVAGPSDSESSPNIFKLNTDCFDLIFDYLSMKDLHSFGLTCKALQQLAGEYFQRNYKSSEKFSSGDGIYTVYSDNNGVLNQRTQTSGFNRFINYISYYYENLEPLRYIQMHSDEFSSINHIYFVCLNINPTKIEHLRGILSKLEVVQIRQCTIDGDFYDIFLKFCGNLKRIYIQDDLGYILDESGSSWLLQEYPSIEHLQLTPRYSFKINELNAFFERNQSLKSFSTSSRCLWENRHELIESNVQLDKLEIQILDNFHRHLINMQSICSLLNQFYERGLYKRLHLYVKRIDQKASDYLTTLCALEMLSVRQFSESYSLSNLINLKELEIGSGISLKDIEILAVKLVNLERLSIGNVVANDILPFIRHSTKLYRIQAHFKDGDLDLMSLNEERNKLKGARKIIVYVPNNIFLATKWTTFNGIIDYSLIEMRRASQL